MGPRPLLLALLLAGCYPDPFGSTPKSPEPTGDEPSSVKHVRGGGDEDKDGILNRNDDCPGRAEDEDGNEDQDGCPEAEQDE